MSSSKSPEDTNSAWSPSSAIRDQQFSDGVALIKNGTRKVFDGSQEAVTGLIVLLLLLLGFRDGDDEDTLKERNAKWEERTEPIQERFEQENVTEEDVEQAIEWARSE